MRKVKIDVDFYDANEQKDFETNYPSVYGVLKDYTGKSIEVPYADFQTYFIFRQQSDRSGYITFNDLSKKVKSQWVMFKDYYNYDNSLKKFNSILENNNEINEISESLGVAGALSVASKIFLNLTQADWKRIPKNNKNKDFDYEHIASDGNRFIVIEAKGSIVKNNERLSPLSNHKASIKKKKNDVVFLSKYPKSKYLYFGAITAADMIHDLKLRFVDPPFEGVHYDPKKYKLLANLYYYLDIAKIISPRSYLTLLLANRIQTIENIEDYEKLNNVPLVNASFEKIAISDNFIKSKSHSKNGDIIGNIIATDADTLVFIGTTKNILYDLIEQDFSKFLYAETKTPSELFTDLDCTLPINYNSNRFLEDSEIRRSRNENSEASFKINTKIIKASSQILYSVIDKKTFNHELVRPQ